MAPTSNTMSLYFASAYQSPLASTTCTDQKKKIPYGWDGGGASRDVYTISIHVAGARDNCVCDWGSLRLKGYSHVRGKIITGHYIL